MHCRDHVVPVELVVDLHVGKALRNHDGLFARQGILDCCHQVRAIAFAARRKGRGRIGKLQRRGKHISLADRRDDRLAGKPDLVRALAKCLLLPFPRWHQPVRLADHVQPGLVAEAELVEILVHRVNTDVATDLVEIHIAGLRDRIEQVDLAMALRPPVPVPVGTAGEAVPADADRPAGQVRGADLEGGQRQHRLDRRPRRIAAAHRPIEQRPILVILQQVVFAGTHTCRKCIRIERR